MSSSRIVPDSEFNSIWPPIAAAWDLPPDGFQWFPLCDTLTTGLVAFEKTAFDAVLGPAWLHALLAKHGVRRVIRVPEFSELSVDEMDLTDADFAYSGAETYWFDAESSAADWFIYVSHEESITLAGPLLLAAVYASWPEWSANLWNHVIESHRPLPPNVR